MKIFFALPLLTLTINLFPQISTNGLIGFWPFNGNANDESGNGNNGIVHGASLIPDRFNCTPGSAYYFDGINDYIEIGTLPGLIENLNSYSISFWYRSGSDISEWSSIIGSINIAAAEMAFEINFHRNGLLFQFGRISFIIRSNDDKYLTLAVSASETFDNQWHHIVFNFEDPGNNIAGIFIDGISREIEYVTTEGPTNYSQFENPFTIGATNDRSTIKRFYKGCIDDFRIYKSPLTEKEIKTLYHAGGWPFTNVGLVAYYPFNGNAKDESGNGNDGIVYGATLTEDRCGNVNSAYSFNGKDNYINCGKEINTSIRSLTVSFWFKFSVSGNMAFVNNFNARYGEWGFQSCFTETTGLESRVGAGANNHILAILSNIFLNDNMWHMFTSVYSKESKRLALYLDNEFVSYDNYYGSSSGFTEDDSLMHNYSNDWIIGAYSEYFSDIINNGPWFYNGDMDDIRIYNRSLSQEEISALFYSDCYSGLINGVSEVCQGQTNVRYNVQYFDCVTSYAWDYSGTGATINGNADSVFIDFGSEAVSGNLSLTITDNIMNTHYISIPVIVNPLPLNAGAISGDNKVCQNQNYIPYNVPIIENAESYIWNYSGTGAHIAGNSNNVTISFADNATSGNLTVAGYNGCGIGPISEDFFIEVSSCNVDTNIISIPNWFTPNGDGINETFVIQGLTENSILMIFDRAGKKVYENDHYQQHWDGRDNNGTPLPADVYWYVLRVPGYLEEFKGWVYLMK
jgi:gliding motility-associated-like protein